MFHRFFFILGVLSEIRAPTAFLGGLGASREPLPWTRHSQPRLIRSRLRGFSILCCGFLGHHGSLSLRFFKNLESLLFKHYLLQAFPLACTNKSVFLNLSYALCITGCILFAFRPPVGHFSLCINAFRFPRHFRIIIS